MENTGLDKLLENLNKGLSELSDLNLFKQIINDSLFVFNLTELMLSEELRTSRPTINRWKTGTTAPHILIRESIYKTLQKRARSLSKKLTSGSSSGRAKSSGGEGDQVAQPY